MFLCEWCNGLGFYISTEHELYYADSPPQTPEKADRLEFVGGGLVFETRKNQVCICEECFERMKRKQRVYGGNFHYKGRQVRGIIAGTQKQAAQAIGVSLGHIRAYWSETGNELECEIARNEPGVVFWCENRFYDRTYTRLEKDGGG